MGPRTEAAESRPQPEVVAWVEGQLGRGLRFTDLSHAHRVTSVYRVDGSAEPAWLKVHSQTRKYRQEHDAYGGLVPWLANRGHRVPRCLASHDGTRALLLSHVEGAPFEAVAEPVDAFRAAGRFLADVHRYPAVPDVLPVPEAIRKRAERWCAEAVGHAEPADIDEVRRRCSHPTRFASLGRVHCHRDFSPRNWLVAEDGLGFIDFEHTHTDLALHDFARLVDWEFHRWPDVEGPFFEGYGRTLDATELDQLLALRWLYALGTVAWSSRHGDTDFEIQGRAVLERLRALAG